MRHKWNEEPVVLWAVQVSADWCVFSREESTVVGPEEVGNMVCCRIEFVGAAVWTAGRVGRPDC